MQLKDKVVVITGSTKGFGLELAKLFLNEGSKIVISSDNKEHVEKVAGELGTFGIAADVSKLKDVENLATEVQNKFGGIDMWVNNAGLWMTGPIDQADMAEAQKMFDVNVFGVIYGTRVAIQLMKEKNSGSIVNIISKVALGIRPGLAMYVASKWAVNGFVKTIKEEYKDTKISFLSVFPGGMKTSLYDKKAKLDTYDQYMDPKIAAIKVINNLKKENPESDLVVLREGEQIIKNGV